MAIVTVQDTDEEKATVEAELTKLSDYMYGNFDIDFDHIARYYQP